MAAIPQSLTSLEGDRKEFEHHGFPCLIIRTPQIGILCGYVGVEEGHWAYGKGENELDLEVHGGITFAEIGDDKYRPAVFWWIGFDCGHAGDAIPMFRHTYENGSYRDEVYVEAECRRLAEQLAAGA